MAANPSIQLGTDGNWAIKEDNLLAYKKDGTRFFNKEFDFTRNTTATFVDKDGLIKVSATNTPRINYTNFDYENGVVVPYSGEGSLLLEPQSTNIQTYSTTLSTNWLVTGTGVVTYNNAISPDGTNNATYFSAPASSSKGLYNQLPISTSTYTASVWAKSKGLGNDKFQLGEGSGTGTGGVGEFTATSEWQRFEITGTTVSGTRPVGVFQPIDSSAMDILFWGYQYEQQSYATSYIPTNGSAVTRNAEVCNNSGSAQDFNSEEGVLYADISALADDLTNRFISLTDGTQNNSVCLFYGGGSSNFIRSEIKSNNVTQAELTTTSYPITNFNKIAVKYKGNDFALWVNGVEVATDTSGSTPIGLNDLSFNRANILDFYGKTKNLKVFKRAMSDGELYLLTVPQYQSYQEMATALNYTL